MPLSALTGTRIRERRATVGLRQADLARAAGISPSYLNLIEHNRRRAAPDVVARIAAALGVAPEALTGGGEAALIDDLREAAAAADGAAQPEADRAEEFAGRFPGWAALVAAQHRRIAALDRAVETLADRMSHDPHLSAALHEVLSVAAAVRSTATILTGTPDLDPVWRGRFEANLAADSERLALGAEALVAYLDAGAEREAGLASPQKEVEEWLAGRGWHLPELEGGGDAAAPPDLASAAARALAAEWIATARDDAAAMPLPAVAAALAASGGDPGRMARLLGVEPLRAMRRLAVVPASVLPPGLGPFGLILCDGAGAVLFRKPLPGFTMPRFGAACPLWPLYGALSRPGLPVVARLAMPGPTGGQFLAQALCAATTPGGFDAPPVLRSAMLIRPAPGGEGPVQPVGPSCRVCPRPGCAARREPSIVSEI